MPGREETKTVEDVSSGSMTVYATDQQAPGLPTESLSGDAGSTAETSKHVKAPDGGVAVVDEGGEVKEKVEDNTIKKESWNSTATLYCAVNGFPHSTMLNAGVPRCPSCDQNLAKVDPKLPLPIRNKFIGKTGRGGESGAKEEGDVKDKNAPEEQPKVEHSVEYRDLGNNVVATEVCDGPFHLERQRNMALKKGLNRNKQTVMKTVTVLRTTLPSENHMPRYGTRFGSISEKMDIIGNSQVSVSVWYTRITIHSGLFIDALKSLVSYDTGDKLEGSSINIEEPFSVIGHHLQELENYVRRIDERISISAKAKDGTVSGDDVSQETVAPTVTPGEVSPVELETRIHLSLVLDYVNTIIKEPISQERTRYQQDMPTCTYRMLWYLFRPGSIVYVKSDHGQDAFMVDSVEMDGFALSSSDTKHYCAINLWYLEFNGEHVTRARHLVKVRPFKGERPIISLGVVPCEVYDKIDGGKLRATLEERGKKWVDHTLGKQLIYKEEPLTFGSQTKVIGRAYADPAAYYNLEDKRPTFEPVNYETVNSWHKNRRYEPPMFSLPQAAGGSIAQTKYQTPISGYDHLTLKDIGEFEDDSGHKICHLLCSRKLNGFVFNTRTWETLDIDHCHPVKPDKNPFARLVMPYDRKLMIKALVYKYTDPKYAGGDGSQVWGADFIKNKGEGLVFLLHGGPGVGKTFTAECIAEFTGRPLLSLTCGDIGTDEVKMEKELRRWLRLAHRWGAVMLIDEADVFLEKRQDSDIRRNSLVSIFLREIEYYQGILFLTSNRVGKFDDAIVSRIHVVIHYKALDDEYRDKIWNQFFDKLETERGKTMKIERSAKRYVLDNERMGKMKWNGREIRNAFQTAVALAEYRFLTKPPQEKEEGEIAVLEEEDFKQICDMTINFKEYLVGVNEGQDEEARALLDKARGVEYY